MTVKDFIPNATHIVGEPDYRDMKVLSVESTDNMVGLTPKPDEAYLKVIFDCYSDVWKQNKWYTLTYPKYSILVKLEQPL